MKRICIVTLLVLMFLSACQSAQVLTTLPEPTYEEYPTVETEASSTTIPAEPTKLPPTETPTLSPTLEATETPQPEVTYIVEGPDDGVEIDIVATYTAVAVDYQDRLATMMETVGACEPSPKADGWQEYRIDDLGLSLSVPGDWFETYEFTPSYTQGRKPIIFEVDSKGVATISSNYGEGITIEVWQDLDGSLLEFIKGLLVFEAERLGSANQALPIPYLNSIVNGHPASISYSPEYDTGEWAGRPSTIVVATKIGDMVIIINYTARSGYDPSETMKTMLSSLSIEDVAGGETDISETVMCQAYLHSCLKQCPYIELTVPDLSGIEP